MVPIELDSGIVEVKAPLLELERAFSSKAFAEKYPARNLGVVPVTAALTFDVLEKFLVTERDGDFVVCKRHDRHMVLKPLGRKALAGGYRIIIACRSCLIEAFRVRGQGQHFKSLILAEDTDSPAIHQTIHFGTRYISFSQSENPSLYYIEVRSDHL